MSNSVSNETIAQRIERGKAQNSTEDSAIVPFPDGTGFHDPLNMMKSYDRTWLVGHLNNGAQLTPYVYGARQSKARQAPLVHMFTYAAPDD